MSTGPLGGVRIVEFAGLGPTPFAAMTLADMGAEVVRITRRNPRHILGLDYDILDRGRPYVELDLKDQADLETARGLVRSANGLIEGMRPGVMERLGLGPAEFENDPPGLVYGRMTGWGQTGPLATAAGHDINYIALSGALHAIGAPDAPIPPLNLLGDFGGGGMYLAFGMVCALLEASKSGKGQVVDAAIVDGTAHLMAMIYGLHRTGNWSEDRQSNVLDGGAPFYGTYRCACGGFVAIGSIEPQFYGQLVEKTGVQPEDFRNQMDRSDWPRMRALLEGAFLKKTRDQWCKIMEGSDVCFAPVLSIDEAPDHAHNKARGIFKTVDGVCQPAPAPRLSRTPGKTRPASQKTPLDARQVLARWQSGEKQDILKS